MLIWDRCIICKVQSLKCQGLRLWQNTTVRLRVDLARPRLSLVLYVPFGAFIALKEIPPHSVRSSLLKRFHYCTDDLASTLREFGR